MSIVAILVVLLHGYAWINPTALDWGVHQFAFLPAALSVAFFISMVIVLGSKMQTRLLSLMGKIIAYIERRSTITVRVIAGFFLTALAGMFWFGRQNIPFLGDGFLVFKALGMLPNPSYIAQSNFQNEPLSALMFYSVHTFLPKLGIAIEGLQTYHVVSIVFGLATVMLFWFLAKVCGRNAMERILSFCFFMAMGGSQLFFGYVEDYAPLYWAMTLFILFAVLYLKEKISLVFVGIAYAILFLLHLGTLIIFPALLYLFYESVRRKQFAVIPLTIACMIPIIAGGLYITGYSFQGFIHNFGTASQVSFFAQDPLSKSYEWYSPYHLLDVANMILLLSPFALPSLVIVGIYFYDRGLVKENISILLIITAICGLVFISGVNSLLGMSRDWDLFSSFGLPLCILSVYIWNRFVKDENLRQRFLILMVIVTMLHTIPSIIVNAKGERSYKRFVTLTDERLWSKKSLANAYDGLGIYFNMYGNNREALHYFLKYFQLDPHNPRLLLNIGVIYAKMGDTAKSIAFLQKSADYGSPELEVYRRVGVYLENQNKPDDALHYLKLGLELDSTSAGINNEVGLILLRDKQSVNEALPYLERAMRLDSNLAEPYSNAAVCYMMLNEPAKMNYCIDKYLQLRPDDRAILRLRQDAKEMHTLKMKASFRG
jgi:tetratricopeptide (TPR) repeat protein